MPRNWMKVAALSVALACTAAAAPAPVWPNLSRAPTAEDRAMMAKDWAAARDALGRALAENYRPGTRFSPGSTGQNIYKSWLLLWKWSDLLARDQAAEANRFIARHTTVLDGGRLAIVPAGEPLPAVESPAMRKLVERALTTTKTQFATIEPTAAASQKAPLAKLIPPEILSEWTADPAFLQLLLDNLSPGDYTPQVLANLVQMRQADAKKFHEYAPLAVAIAVVYDQKRPAFWPHRQVQQVLVPVEEHSVTETFALWVKANDSPRRLMDLRTLTPAQLKFVVDAPLRETEFAWARENIRTSLREFTKAFTDIVYAKARATQGNLTWTTGPYTLSGIKLRGGICVDQAYFAMIAGKARGVPTLFFSGDGTDGGHAWFGYMLNKDKWELDGGRYENQGYVTGHALDPQTWTPINDHELEFLMENFHARAEYAASRDDLALAALFEAQGNRALAAKALDSAIAVCSRNADAWEAKTVFLDNVDAPATVLRTHHEAAVRQFANVPDIKTRHQAALAALALEEGDEAKARALEKQMAAQNQGDRADLAIEVVAGKMSALLAARDYPTALREYPRQLTQIGSKAPYSFLNEVTIPVVVALANAGDLAHAKEMLALTRQAFKPEPKSMLDKKLLALESDLGKIAATTPAGPAPRRGTGNF